MLTRLEQLVIEAARLNPDGLAVKDRDGAWTYRELDDWSDRLACWLSRQGVQPGDRVAVWAPKSCRAVAALQAALRAGATYVPIDPATPAPRARTILDDCGVRLLVTTRALAASLPPKQAGPPSWLVDADESWAALPRGRRVPAGGGQDDRAYILYTSGSTGTPKGVCISHRNALAFVTWAIDAVGVKGPAVFANHASFNFDLSVFDLYGAFLVRGTVCLVPETLTFAAARLVEFIREHRISVWYSVPSAVILMMEHGGLLDREEDEPAVVIFAGEPFPIRYLRPLRTRWRRARMFNFYGPTETNVCTSHEVVEIPSDQVTPVPIGTAASGDRVWTIKDDGTPAGEGERGELLVDGPTVMLGYWGAEPQRGPYRTGDICVRRPDGGYDLVGRRDHMIKRRGYRIEPGEIEAALSQHPSVAEIAVVPVGDGGEQRLVAAIVPGPERAPTLLELKVFGARLLPPYMLVDRVHTLEALPRTANGKIDRLSLRRALAATIADTPAESLPKRLANGSSCAIGSEAKRCAACRGELPALTETEIASRVTQLADGWRVVRNHHIERQYAFPDFVQALAFTNRVGVLAEAEGHHPEIEVGWGRVRVAIWTHAVDGLTETDFALAAKTDRLQAS